MNGWVNEVGNKSKMFRASMNGFNKEDVNKYIIDINNEFSAKEEDYKKEIASLSEKLREASESISKTSELEGRLAEAENNSALLSDKLIVETDARVNAEKALEEAVKEAQALKEALTIKEAELTAAEAELNELRTMSEKLNNDDSEDELDTNCEKIRLYDELRGNIGDILLNANKNADDIIKDAERKAADLTRVSRERADAAKRRLTVISGRTVAALRKNAILNADNCVREFRAYTDDISHLSRTMTVNLEKKYADLSMKMESLGNELEEGIKSVLREFDKSCTSAKNSVNTESDK